jgi:hypothetical protein
MPAPTNGNSAVSDDVDSGGGGASQYLRIASVEHDAKLEHVARM